MSDLGKCIDCGRHTSQRRGFAGLWICDACWLKRCGVRGG